MQYIEYALYIETVSGCCNHLFFSYHLWITAFLAWLRDYANVEQNPQSSTDAKMHTQMQLSGWIPTTVV